MHSPIDLTIHQTNLTSSELKAFADDNSNVAQMVQFFCDRAENIVGKRENACYKHFVLFPQCFQNDSFHG